MPDWSSARAQFPALRNFTYLNTATFGQLATRTVDAVARHFTRRDETACADFLDWFSDADLLREKLARLVNCAGDDIAFVPNTCTALGILLNGIDWRPGDEVLIPDNEFPSNIYAPAHLEKDGVVLKQLPWPELCNAITERTRLVALSSVNYTTGFRAPVEEIAADLRRRGILLYVDATQSMGALRFDCAQVQPDMLSVNCYKWMLAPTGAAFMVVHPELRARLDPLSIGWRSHFDWRNVAHLHHGAPQFKTTAEKYEGGMLATPALYGLDSSVDTMFELGPGEIQARALELAAKTRAALEGLGAELLPYHDTAILAAQFPGHDVSTLATELKQRRVLVSARKGRLRVSTHFYNDESDIDVLASELKKLL